MIIQAIFTVKVTKISRLFNNSVLIGGAIFLSQNLICGEVKSWECNKFENAKIIGEVNVYLGKLGPRWLTDSIYNSSSIYSKTWHKESIFNDSNEYGNSYSNNSVFNEGASSPPKIISDDGFVGYISIGPSWDNERFSPYDLKYTCDWD